MNPVVQDIRRLQKIAYVLTKHGFSAFVRRTPLAKYITTGEVQAVSFTDDKEETPTENANNGVVDAALRFRLVLQDLGPTYVKLGQVMSTRVDLFPQEFIHELTLLRDRVAPIPFEEIKKQIETSLGKPISELYDFIDETPIAAASIGQVHAATTHAGNKVVVKVQRPGIQTAIEADLDILYFIAAMLEATIQEFEVYQPKAVIRAFEAAILAELDFRAEAKNSEQFAFNFRDVDYVSTPKVYHELSCKHILTLERIEETPLSDIEGGTERAQEILQKILDATVKQVMYDGFFHGDPHPGNIFVTDDNRLIFIDFGLVGRLTMEQQDVIVFIIISSMNRDVDGLARVLLRMGNAKGRIDLRALKSDISDILEEYLIDNLNEIDVGGFIKECTNAAQRHGLSLNSNYVILTKVAATIEGIMRELEPDLDLMEIGRPYAHQLTRDRFSMERLTHSAARAVFRFSASASELPQQVEQVLMDLENGNFEMQFKNEALNELGNQVNILGTRMLLSISASGLAIAAAIILHNSTLMVFSVPVVDIAGVTSMVLAMLFFLWSLGWHIFGGGADMRLKIKPLIRFFRRSNRKET